MRLHSFPHVIPALVAPALAAALLGSASVPAAASTIRVDPIKVEISAERKIASVRLKNEEAAPVAVRAYVVRWSQKDGEDVYGDSEAVIVSPPVATIAPGATQLVRVGLRAGSPSKGAYRLIIEEIPHAAPTGGVNVALRLNLPLFVNLSQGRVSQLSWKAFQRPDRAWVIEATNPTDSYVRAEAPEVAAAAGLKASSVSTFGVVLPNSSRRWVVGAKPEIADKARFDAVQRGLVPDGRPRS